MQLTDRDLFLLTQCAISAAFQAGQIINEYKQKPVKVNNKSAGESLASQVVTEVDHLCQTAILKVLHPSCEYFDLALLSEESPDDRQRLEKDYFWCIDPLDGTLPFIESIPGYSVSIALVNRNGEAVIGVVYDPYRKKLYQASQGQGAFCNGIAMVKANAVDSLTLISDKSIQNHPNFEAILQHLQSLCIQQGLKHLNTIFQGGAAMNAIQVLETGNACYLKLPKAGLGGGSLWDYAATACIFKELQATVSDAGGEPLDLNNKTHLFLNHCGVLYSDNALIAEQLVDFYQSATE